MEGKHERNMMVEDEEEWDVWRVMKVKNGEGGGVWR